MIIQPHSKHLEALEDISDPAVLLDAEYKILATNTAYREAFHRGKDITGEACYRASHSYDRPCDEAGENCPLKISIFNQSSTHLLHIHDFPNGKQYVDVTVEPIRGEQGEILYFREVLRQTMIASAKAMAHGLVGVSQSFMQMLEEIHRVARVSVPVLLLGESGTGKELIARALHDASHQSDKPFVPVECSGLSEKLFESELFGHRKGAFTGAQSEKKGLVEVVQGGTLFLDEIGDVPPQLQVKLLRLLESQTYRKVGDTDVRHAQFRLICATNRNLDKLMAKKQFRRDLYYRISAFPIHLPPLRERPEDIGLLAQSILLRIVPERHLTISQDVFDLLIKHDFPGNIRELINFLERARILADGHELTLDHFPGLTNAHHQPINVTKKEGRFSPSKEVIPLKELEKEYLHYLSQTFRGPLTKLAAKLEVSTRTLNRKMQGIDKNQS